MRRRALLQVWWHLHRLVEVCALLLLLRRQRPARTGHHGAAIGRKRSDAERSRRRTGRAGLGILAHAGVLRHDVPQPVAVVAVKVALHLEVLDAPLQLPVHALEPLDAHLHLAVLFLLARPEAGRGAGVAQPLLVGLLRCLVDVNGHVDLLAHRRRDCNKLLAVCRHGQCPSSAVRKLVLVLAVT